MMGDRNCHVYLSDIPTGESVYITKVLGHGAFRKRITEMGFVKGKKVKVIKNAPLQDPIEYEIMGYNMSLRRSEAAMIEVEPLIEGDLQQLFHYEGIIIEETPRMRAIPKTKRINVALVGNPNSGKTTLFNRVSGSHERVGNYGGVTVDVKEAVVKFESYKMNFTDFPGTYSITEYTPEELFVRNHIWEKKPDVVVNVVDASNLERNLFLTTQLIDMDIKVVIALNMYDELEYKGIELNYHNLGLLLGIPIIPTIAVKGVGLVALLEKIIEVYEDQDPITRHIHINYGSMIEESIDRIRTELRKNKELTDQYSKRYLAIKLLERDQSTLERLKVCSNYESVKKIADAEIRRLEKEYKEKSETVIADAKYGFISGALLESVSPNKREILKKKKNFDRFLTHKYWGFPIFFFFMWLMFQTTFTLGAYPMEWIEMGVGYLGKLLSTRIPDGALHDLLIDGVIGGVGGVIVFLPNILILFFFISLMEDTGYMARVSFIMDKLMHKIGLHGKSFIPLLMGFGCNVPAIMATRTLENRKDRIMTMLIIPFMSCSARLPVYLLIISAFFPKHQGLILFSIYLIGILIAVLSALLLKNTVFSKQDVPFVMELPPYRLPTMRNTLRHMWHKASQYLRKMGTVILVASIIIWVLSYFPQNKELIEKYDYQIAQVELNETLSSVEKDKLVLELELEKEGVHQEQSYIGQMGKFVEPVLRPLGFDWKIGISIITGLAAKEIVVSTMGVLYHADFEADENSHNLAVKLQQQVHTTGKLKGQKVFTPLVAFGFMLFILIYFPCVAVIAAIRREASLGWAIFTIFYTTLLAWLVAFAVYQIGIMI